MKLSGQVAVVTGAASGMGKAIAELFALEGAKVIVSDLRQEAADVVVSGIVAKGGQAVGIAADVSVEKDIQQLIDRTVETFGTVDILINNAGVMDNFIPAADLTDEVWDRVLAINTTGPMRATRKVLPIFLEKQSGVIVNVASVGGLNGSRAGAAYTASKHALIGFTKNVGFQYAAQGVRCNAIAPGGVNTGIGQTINEPNAFGLEKAMSGAGFNPRSGESDEIATIALFLASRDSSFVNGTVVTADAGWTAY